MHAAHVVLGPSLSHILHAFHNRIAAYVRLDDIYGTPAAILRTEMPRDIYHQGHDLILMDIQMPLMSGFDATRAIRARETVSGKRTPIVAMTATAMAGDREKCLESMDAYVAKPLNITELFETIEKLLAVSAETSLV